MKLKNPLLTSLSLVSRIWISINVVRVDVEGHQADRFDGRRVNYGHIIGGVDADSGHICAGAGSDVWHAVLKHTSANDIQHILLVEVVQQLECVSSTNKNGLGLAGSKIWVLSCVN